MTKVNAQMMGEVESWTHDVDDVAHHVRISATLLHAGKPHAVTEWVPFHLLAELRRRAEILGSLARDIAWQWRYDLADDDVKPAMLLLRETASRLGYRPLSCSYDRESEEFTFYCWDGHSYEDGDPLIETRPASFVAAIDEWSMPDDAQALANAFWLQMGE